MTDGRNHSGEGRSRWTRLTGAVAGAAVAAALAFSLGAGSASVAAAGTHCATKAAPFSASATCSGGSTNKLGVRWQ